MADTVAVRQRGFTLIEMLVALAITATVSVIAYSSLDSAINARDSMLANEKRLAELQRFFLMIGRDIRHAVPRPVTSEYGEAEAALRAEEGALLQLALTRGGWENFVGSPRSNLQRVNWWLESGSLRRAYWPVLDRAGELPLLESEVLSEVTELRLRFLAQSVTTQSEREWLEIWPIADGAVAGLPLAVEVTVELEDWGSATRIFLPALGS